MPADRCTLVQGLLDWTTGRRRESPIGAQTRAKQAVVFALWDTEILLALGPDGPAVGRGLDDLRVLWAFTDHEAFESWHGDHDGDDGPFQARPISGDRHHLGTVLVDGKINKLILNAAGPAVAAVDVADEYLAASRPLLYHPPRLGDDPVLEAGRRAPARAEHARILDHAHGVLAAGNWEWFHDGTDWCEPIIRFGDLLRYGMAFELIGESVTRRTDTAPSVARARYPWPNGGARSARPAGRPGSWSPWVRPWWPPSKQPRSGAATTTSPAGSWPSPDVSSPPSMWPRSPSRPTSSPPPPATTRRGFRERASRRGMG
ncbi:MAG: hypothetical protein M3Y91_14115, partial [Actinomycetota bacterium]|nr:hypothetical protein [Actinomycetota bacterium]